MTKQMQSERDAAIAELRATLTPGTTVYTVLRHVSRSGMSRDIDVYVMEGNEPRRITWTVSKATDIRYDRKAEALKVGGCGMDMGFHVVYNLSRALYDRGHAFACIGKDCPSNDHNNAYLVNRQGMCIICQKNLTPGVCNHCGSVGVDGQECGNCEPQDDLGPTMFQPVGKVYLRKNLPDRPHKYHVCSRDCATKPWVHSDGGYALKHRWM